jgi:hypothetical protein
LGKEHSARKTLVQNHSNIGCPNGIDTGGSISDDDLDEQLKINYEN